MDQLHFHIIPKGSIGLDFLQLLSSALPLRLLNSFLQLNFQQNLSNFHSTDIPTVQLNITCCGV